MAKTPRQTKPKKECGMYADLSESTPPAGCTDVRIGCRRTDCLLSDSQTRGGDIGRAIAESGGHIHIPPFISRQQAADKIIQEAPPEMCPNGLKQSKPTGRRSTKTLFHPNGPSIHV